MLELILSVLASLKGSNEVLKRVVISLKRVGRNLEKSQVCVEKSFKEALKNVNQ